MSDAYMRETVIRTASASDCIAHTSATDAASHSATDAPPPPTAPSSSETHVVPIFETHARHTRIRLFLHSFKGAVLCATACNRLPYICTRNRCARYNRLSETQRLQASAQAKEEGNVAYGALQPLRAASKYRMSIDLVRNVGLGSTGAL